MFAAFLLLHGRVAFLSYAFLFEPYFLFLKSLRLLTYRLTALPPPCYNLIKFLYVLPRFVKKGDLLW